MLKLKKSMKICKPLYHLPEAVQELFRAFSEFPEFRDFIKSEFEYHGKIELFNELELNEEQNKIRNGTIN